MERIPKKEQDAATRAAQARGMEHPAQQGLADRLNNSPRMIAQRQKWQTLFNGAAKLPGDGQTVQAKPETAQRVTKEEPLQGEFGAVQRVGEEEPLQRKFDAAQRAEEEPLQGKLDAAPPAQLKEEPASPNHTGLPVNDDAGLEREADVMGARVLQMTSVPAVQRARTYASAEDVRKHNPKWYATNPEFSDQEKITIAQWIEDNNNTSPTIRPPLVNHTVNSTSDPTATYTWQIAAHMDVAGPTHGGKHTPHAQIARDVTGVGQTTMAVAYNDGRIIRASSALPRDDTETMTFAQTQTAMSGSALPPEILNWIHTSVSNASDEHARGLQRRNQPQTEIDWEGGLGF